MTQLDNTLAKYKQRRQRRQCEDMAKDAKAAIAPKPKSKAKSKSGPNKIPVNQVTGQPLDGTTYQETLAALEGNLLKMPVDRRVYNKGRNRGLFMAGEKHPLARYTDEFIRELRAMGVVAGQTNAYWVYQHVGPKRSLINLMSKPRYREDAQPTDEHFFKAQQIWEKAGPKIEMRKQELKDEAKRVRAEMKEARRQGMRSQGCNGYAL